MEQHIKNAAARLSCITFLLSSILMRALSALFAILLLASCTTIQFTPDPLKDATAVYSWEARGRMVFQCSYDSEGFFWNFVQTEGELLNDAGQRQAVLQPNFGITARDGSTIHAKIISQGEQISPRDLRTAVFFRPVRRPRDPRRRSLHRPPTAFRRHAARHMHSLAKRSVSPGAVSRTLCVLPLRNKNLTV